MCHHRGCPCRRHPATVARDGEHAADHRSDARHGTAHEEGTPAVLVGLSGLSLLRTQIDTVERCLDFVDVGGGGADDDAATTQHERGVSGPAQGDR
jgi:hypothetical protein